MKRIILFLIVMVVLSSFVAAVLPEDLNNSISSYWKFDGGATDFFGSNNGTVSGAINNISYGKINQGYFFDGINDGILAGTTAVTTFTVSTWVKTVNDANYRAIFQNGNIIINKNPSEQIHVNRAGHGTSIDSTGTISTSSMTHVVVVVTGSATKIYLDGSLDSNHVAETFTAGDIMIGRYSSGQFWSGNIDEVGFWSRELNITEIEYLYDNNSPNSNQQPPFESAILSITNNTFNMTSDGGNITWRTDKTAYVKTTDGTPNVIFDTNVDASCSLRNVVGNYNVSHICSSTGGTSHSCNLYYADRLSFGASSVYASCESGAETDTTGALNINMTAGTGGGLTSCISAIDSSCGASIANNCAVIS